MISRIKNRYVRRFVLVPSVAVLLPVVFLLAVAIEIAEGWEEVCRSVAETWHDILALWKSDDLKPKGQRSVLRITEAPKGSAP